MKARDSTRTGDPAGPSAPAGRGRFLPGALLFLLVAGVFLPAVTHDFITYDDPVYVTGNAHVTGGLTWANVRWAFHSTEASNWHPLTWLSHMADCQLFGLSPWGHHLTSVLLHAANCVLLFAALGRMTGAPWRSLFVAALFGLHPLHVESVAWVSERKDVLSAAFWMLTLWAWARRVELTRARCGGAPAFYGLALVCFALGLMCKPMLVTLPFVLLLLDWWPLGRWAGTSPSARWGLVLEKVPFFALSVAASAVALYAQHTGEAVASAGDFPWPIRLANALISYCRYLEKCLVPTKLAVFYPYFAEQPPLLETLLAGALLAAVTAAAGALARRRPYLLVGWLWFAGTLVPVIGLVQIGGQSMADRYSYVPLIGVFVMATWAVGDLAASLPHRRWVLGLAAGATLAGLAALCARQLAFWKDGTSLFRHALAVTEDNWVAHANLSATLAKSSPQEAGAEFQEAVRILAAFAEKHDRRGVELERMPGRSADALREFRAATRIMPDLPGPHYNLGVALAKEPGGLPEAVGEFQAAVRLRPDFADAHYNLGIALAGMPGRLPEAIGEFQAAARLRPDFAGAHYNLGVALARTPGRAPEAIAELQAALRLKPDIEQAREMIERLRAAPR